MGLFTGSSSASRRPTSAAPLKRRSLGRSRESLSKTRVAAVAAESSQSEVPSTPLSGQVKSENSEKSHHQTPWQPASHSAPPTTQQLDSTQSATLNEPNSDEEADPDLADLQSDNTLLYDRHLPLDSALGVHPLAPPGKFDYLERIDAYVAEHYLDCFGITRCNELVGHHNRIVPFFAKAPRFLSIHSLKRKELERDYTEVADTIDTCPRQELCLGRCLLGFSCPTRDLTSPKTSSES